MVKKIVILVFVFVCVFAIFANKKRCNMAIEYTGTSNQYIDFTPASANVRGLLSKTIMFWIDLDTLNTSRDFLGMYGGTPLSDDNWDIGASSTANKMYFRVEFTGVPGQWRTTSDLTTNQTHIAITYNGSSTSNTPVFYINNVVDTTVAVTSPTGSYATGANSNLNIGRGFSNTTSFDGLITGIVIYNRILSAAEIADAYNSRLAIPNYNGLVFAPNLCGAAGLQTFDGATLGSTNYLKDMVSGATGTPNGSPIGRADTYLNWK